MNKKPRRFQIQQKFEENNNIIKKERKLKLSRKHKIRLQETKQKT